MKTKKALKTIQDAIEEEALRRTNERIKLFVDALAKLTGGDFYGCARNVILSVPIENPEWDPDDQGFPSEPKYLPSTDWYTLNDLIHKEVFQERIRRELYPSFYENVLEEVKKTVIRPKTYPKGDE